MSSPDEYIRNIRKQLALGKISQEVYLELKAEFETMTAEEAKCPKINASHTASSSSGINLGDASVLRENTITSTTHNTKNEFHGPREFNVNVNGERVHVTKTGEFCPICNGLVKDDYFKCLKCKRNYIHVRHQDPKSYLCEDCERERLKEEEERIAGENRKIREAETQKRKAMELEEQKREQEEVNKRIENERRRVEEAARRMYEEDKNKGIEKYPIIGISLGTSNSCVAVALGRCPVVICNQEGSRTIPSMIAFTDGGERLVGQLAKRQAVSNPENTICDIKRLIGRKYVSKEVQSDKHKYPFKITEAPNGDAQVTIRGRNYSPVELLSTVLMKLKQTTEDYLDDKIVNAVIAVPAYFTESQRQATKHAGRIAGLNVLRLMSESIAAAMAYGHDKNEDEKIAVFDLGGGKLEISVLELEDGVYEVKSTCWDNHLGGEDFDQRLIDFITTELRNNYNIDLKNDMIAHLGIKEAAEKAKIELSTVMETDINLSFIAVDSAKHLNIKLTRAKLEVLVEDLIEKTIEPCRTAMKDANLTPQDIDEVILVGGMTRMPRVQQKVKEIFGKEPYTGVNPYEAVAVGSAIQAGILSGDIKDVLVLDTLPWSMGIETVGSNLSTGISISGSEMSRVIEKNTTIPSKKSMIFSTAVDNQTVVSIHVLQGEMSMAADNITLGMFELIDILPMPRGESQIEVTFDIDANRIIHVSAKDLGTGKEQRIRITASSGLTEAEIQKLTKEAETLSGRAR